MSAQEDSEAWGLPEDGAYRGGRVHVCAEMCPTCVFRPGNLMQLASGRLRGMVDESLANDSAITCHATLDRPGERALCRGFFDRHGHDVLPIRLALFLGLVDFDPLP